jgi:hypothetical protein
MQIFPRPHLSTSSKRIDGRIVLTHKDSQQVIVLNGVGSYIFGLADGSHSIGEIVTLIAATYDVSLTEAQQDVVDFIQELMIHNMLILEATPTPVNEFTSGRSSR